MSITLMRWLGEFTPVDCWFTRHIACSYAPRVVVLATGLWTSGPFTFLMIIHFVSDSVWLTCWPLWTIDHTWLTLLWHRHSTVRSGGWTVNSTQLSRFAISFLHQFVALILLRFGPSATCYRAWAKTYFAPHISGPRWSGWSRWSWRSCYMWTRLWTGAENSRTIACYFSRTFCVAKTQFQRWLVCSSLSTTPECHTRMQ